MDVKDYGVLAGIVTAFATGLRFVYIKFKEIQLKYRSKLTGNWTNEGLIGGPTESHYIFLKLEVDQEDGDVSGTLCSDNALLEDSITVSASGRIFYKSCILTLTKVSQGKVSVWGKAKVRFSGYKNLRWTTSKDPNNWFPSKTTIWRTDYDRFDS